MGAYLQLVTPGIPILGAWLYGGCYDVEGYDVEFVGAFTNTTPTDAYRGAGRPEATYSIERAMDALARKLDLDPVELRRRNFIREFPKTIASGLTIDSGDYDASLDRALELLDYDGFRREQAERRERGDTKLLGVGFSTYVEMCGLAPSRILGAIRYAAGGWDAATIRCLPTGTVQAVIGTSPHGQGHATTFSQIVADRLGVAFDDVEVLHGDTSIVPLGHGHLRQPQPHGRRRRALERDREGDRQGARRSPRTSSRSPRRTSSYENGTFTVAGTDRSHDASKEAAFAAWTAHNLPDGMEPGLEATAVYDPENFSWPAGAHVAVVEVDTETGSVDLVRYIAVDDVGNVINPQIVDGQVHGGIAQGVAQALFEEAVYDEDGNADHGLDGELHGAGRGRAALVRARPHRDAPSPTQPDGQSRAWGRPARSRPRRR